MPVQRPILLKRGNGFQGVKNKGPGNSCFENPFAVTVQSEFKEIGQNEIAEGMSISLELIRVLNRIQVLDRGGFGLYIADNLLFPVPNPKIRITGFSVLR